MTTCGIPVVCSTFIEPITETSFIKDSISLAFVFKSSKLSPYSFIAISALEPVINSLKRICMG